MASKGHVIAVGSDTRLFEQGVRKGIITPLDDADQKLSDIGKNRGLDKLDGDLKDAQRQTEKLDDKARRAAAGFDKVGTQGHKALKNVSDDAKEGFGKAGKYTDEFSDEAFANFSEVTSSFDGSMQSIVDLTQGTFGGLASLGGPIGLAMGGIAALFGGLASSWVQGIDAAAQKNEQRVADMYSDMIDSGNEWLSQEAIGQAIQDIQDSASDWAQVQNDAKTAGLDLNLMLRAQAGDAGALAQVHDLLAGKVKASMDAADKAAADNKPVAADNARTSQLQQVAARYADVDSNLNSAAGKARVYKQAMDESAKSSKNAASEAKGVGDAVKNIPGSKTVKVNIDVDPTPLRKTLDSFDGYTVYVNPKSRTGNRAW